MQPAGSVARPPAQSAGRGGVVRGRQPGRSAHHHGKEGSTISGLMDGFASAISFALQYGVPLKFLGPEYAVTEAGEAPKAASDRAGAAAEAVV